MYLTFFSGESLIGKNFIWTLVRNEVGIGHVERIMRHWYGKYILFFFTYFNFLSVVIYCIFFSFFFFLGVRILFTFQNCLFLILSKMAFLLG